jgi:hypothetical protein
VTLTELHRGSGHAGNLTTGWVVSVLLHGCLAVWALLFVQRIQLVPQLEPFKWNVMLVSPVSPPAQPSPTTSVPVENPPPTQPTNHTSGTASASRDRAKEVGTPSASPTGHAGHGSTDTTATG